MVSELLSGVLGLSEEGLDTCWILSSELFDDLDGMHKTLLEQNFVWCTLPVAKLQIYLYVVSFPTVLCLITSQRSLAL